MASQEGRSYASMSREDLIYAQASKQILLSKLPGTPNDTPHYRAEVKRHLKQIADELVKRRAPKQSDSSSSIIRPGSASSGSHHLGKPFALMASRQSTGPSTSYGGMEGPDSKKRTFSMNVGQHSPPQPNKFRRPSSPTASAPSFKSSSLIPVIDLTGDSDTLRNQVAEDKTSHAKRDTGEQDSQMAVALQNKYARRQENRTSGSPAPVMPALARRFMPPQATASFSPSPFTPRPIPMPSKAERTGHSLGQSQKMAGQSPAFQTTTPSSQTPVPGPFPEFNGIDNDDLFGDSFWQSPNNVHGQAPKPSNAGTSLGSIINKTAGYNYAAGTDAAGNALDPRIQNLLDDDDALDSHAQDLLDDGNQDKVVQRVMEGVSDGAETLGESEEPDPEGLAVPLYKHQKQALRWMMRAESDHGRKGGILADDMGLGKTITSLSLLIAHRPQPAPGKSSIEAKTTLIVAPLALVDQWVRELDVKMLPGHKLSVFKYHGVKATWRQLREYDVVVTTYGTVASEMKKLYQYWHTPDMPQDSESVSNKFPMLSPETQWYRIILDEAQWIKNRKTRNATAMRTLKAELHWCLTGTPMMNNIGDLGSLLEFLQMHPYSNQNIFKTDFGCLFDKHGGFPGSETSSSMKKLQLLLKHIMLRRTKATVIDGKPIINLPPKSEVIIHVEFGPDEARFYRDLEGKSQVQASKFLRGGAVGKKYTAILTLLLRLRQACCHPYLHLTDLDCGANVEASEDYQMHLALGMKRSVVQRLLETHNFACPMCLDAVDCPILMIPCGHEACSECFIKLTEGSDQEALLEGRVKGKPVCPKCRSPADPKMTVTWEIFKKAHASDNKNSEDDASDIAESDTEDNDPDGSETKKRKNKGKQKESEIKPYMLKKLRRDASMNRVAHEKYMRYLKEIWEPSAKVTRCQELIGSIQSTGEKTIVFSQWTMLLDLLEVALKHELGIDYRRYDGSMSSTARTISVNHFTDRPDVKVMLVSLKAGNAGLNLNIASQVIIMDPFWNPYIENQAIDRAHRIGQQKDVTVYRILIKETVEDRIIALQEKKREMIESALDETTAQKGGALSANDFRFLFGLNRVKQDEEDES